MNKYKDFLYIIALLFCQVLFVLTSGWLSLIIGIGALAATIALGYGIVLELKDQLKHQQEEQEQEKIQKKADNQLLSQSKLLVEENQKKLAQYSSLFIGVKGIISETSEDKLFETFFGLLTKVLPFRAVTYFDANKNTLMLKQSTIKTLMEQPPLSIVIDENSLIGHCAFHKESFDEQSIQQNPYLAAMDSEQPLSVRICVPILYNTELLGIVNIGEVKKNFYSRQEQHFFSVLCMLFGLSLRNVRVVRTYQENLEISEKAVQESELQKDKLTDLFGRFTSPAVVKVLVESQTQITLGGESKILTTMFCDIRSFTDYCEKTPPEQVVESLNEYLSRMSDIILKYDGTLDKYIGDEIMAFWGAPLHQPEHAKLAVQASYEMLLDIKKLQLKWQQEGKEPFSTGFGINTGKIIVGNIGSAKRMDYTVIGDPVNLASRVQSLTRKFNANLLITEYTYEWVKDIVKVRKIGSLQVKGKQESTTLYEVEWVDLKPLKRKA